VLTFQSSRGYGEGFNTSCERMILVPSRRRLGIASGTPLKCGRRDGPKFLKRKFEGVGQTTSRVMDRVYEFLMSAGGSWRSAVIATRLGLNKSSVRSAIHRLKKRHRVVAIESKCGFYMAYPEAREELEDQLKSLLSRSPNILPTVHGLVLSAKIPDSWKLAIQMDNWHSHETPTYVYKSFPSLLCENVELHVFTNDTIEFFISAARRPLDYERFVQVMYFFDGIFLSCFRFSLVENMNEVSVHKIEWNKDFESIKLNGLKSITLSEVAGVIERIYNKDGKLRKETILTDRAVQMKLGDVMEAIMRGGVGEYYLKQTLGIIAQDQKYILEGIRAVIDQTKTIAQLLLHRTQRKAPRVKRCIESQAPVGFGKASEVTEKSHISGSARKKQADSERYEMNAATRNDSDKNNGDRCRMLHRQSNRISKREQGAIQ